MSPIPKPLQLLEPQKVAGRSRTWQLLTGVLLPLLAAMMLLTTGAMILDENRKLDDTLRLVLPAISSVVMGLNAAGLMYLIRKRRWAEKKAIQEQVRPMVRRAVQSVSEGEALHCKA